MAIAGNTRRIMYNGVTTTKNPVEQYGFPDVGTAYDSNNWWHGVF
jgi:hypothetical protein